MPRPFNELILFKTEEQLSRLTGLDHKHLWRNGFDLDDWDWGLRTKLNLEKSWPWLTTRMDQYCVGYKKVVWDGYNYYMLYHS